MITVYANTKTAERYQSDHAGRRLILAGARTQSPAVPFDGGLVF
jgi:hypothetical protein